MIKTYKDLRVWKNAMHLTTEIYGLTKHLPDDERFGLSAQLKRAAVSVPSNIAEGFMRQSTKEYIQFLYISLGSLGEIDTQLELCVELGYTKRHQFDFEKIKLVRKQLFKLISSLKKKL